MSNVVTNDKTNQQESAHGIEVLLERSQHESENNETPQALSAINIPSERPKLQSTMGPISSFRMFLRKHTKSANTRDQYVPSGDSCIKAYGSDESISLFKIYFK